MLLNQTTLYVTSVRQATSFFEILFHVRADYVDDHFAQLSLSGHILMLSVVEANPSNLTLHVQVSSPDREYARLREAGFEVLQAPKETDWGTYSLLVVGPDQMTIDCYCLQD